MVGRSHKVINQFHPDSHLVHVGSLTHLEPEAHVRIQREMRLWPYLVGRLRAFCLFPTGGRARLGVLCVGHEGDRVEGLKKSDDHEGRFIVCKLEMKGVVNGV